MKKKNPIFDKCCRPCMEKFSGDLSLLEIPSHVKRKVMRRFERYHEHFYKVNAPGMRIRDGVRGQGHADAKDSAHSSAAPEMSLLETNVDNVLNLDNDKSGEWMILRSKEKKGGKGGKKKSNKKSKKASKGSGKKKSKKGGKGGSGKKKSKSSAKSSGSTNPTQPAPSPQPPPQPPPPPRELGDLPKPGVAQGQHITGEEFLKHVKCCSICPEQFYLPADFDDFNARAGQDDRYGAALLEERMTSGHRKSGKRSSKHKKGKSANKSGKKTKAGNKKSGKSGKKSSKKSGKKGGKKPATYVESKPEVVGGAELVENIAPEQEPVATGDPSETCCNICPSDKTPEGDIFAHFKPNSGGAGSPPATQVPSFLEIISGSSIKSKDPGDVNVMGPSMVCCPVCPTLQELSHGPMEPLGGIFGEGKVGTQGTSKAES